MVFLFIILIPTPPYNYNSHCVRPLQYFSRQLSSSRQGCFAWFARLGAGLGNRPAMEQKTPRGPPASDSPTVVHATVHTLDAPPTAQTCWPVATPGGLPAALPPVSVSQLRCLKTLFRVYSTRIFLEKERGDSRRPSRVVLSMSRGGWHRFCTEVLRGGSSGCPLLPFSIFLRLYDKHAARLPRTTPREEFIGTADELPPISASVFGMRPFFSMLEEVSMLWWATAGENARLLERSPWVSSVATRDSQILSPLSAMCDEVACSSFHHPESEKMLTARQISPALGGSSLCRRSILPEYLALHDLLSPA